MASSNEFPDDNEEQDVPEASERAVVEESTGVFRYFMYQRFTEVTQHDEEQEIVRARSDALEEIRSYNEPDTNSNIARIGRRLGEVGDEIDAKYKDQFQDMIEQLNLTSSTAYDTFASVARKLFRSGITWGRIVALLCFGYEIAISVIRRGFSGSFLRKIVTFVVEFMLRERIVRWIVRHGGWLSVMDFRLTEPSWWTIGAVIVLATAACLWASRGLKK